MMNPPALKAKSPQSQAAQRRYRREKRHLGVKAARGTAQMPAQTDKTRLFSRKDDCKAFPRGEKR